MIYNSAHCVHDAREHLVGRLQAKVGSDVMVHLRAVLARRSLLEVRLEVSFQELEEGELEKLALRMLSAVLQQQAQALRRQPLLPPLFAGGRRGLQDQAAHPVDP